MDFLNNCAGIATLILFVIYFVGRIIMIVSVKRIWKDELIYKTGKLLAPDLNVVEEYSASDEENDRTGAYLRSREGIRDLRIYTVKQLQNKKLYCKDKLVFSKSFLNINESVDISVELGETIPPIIIEYLTPEYMKVSIEWVINAKNGVASEMIKTKHSLRSFFYYLFI